MKKKKNDFLTVPNVMSLFRIVLVGVFVWIFIESDCKFNHASFVVLAVSALSDVLDGWIARRFDLVSNWGKVLDPAADKLFTISTVVCLAVADLIPIWLVILVFAKEGFMLVGGVILYDVTKAVIPSRWYGKLTTVLFYLTFVIAILLGIFGVDPVISKLVVTILFAVAMAFSIFSVIKYILIAVKIKKQRDNGEKLTDGDDTTV